MGAPPIVRPGRVWLRHITPDPAGTHTLLGEAMSATHEGLGGDQGWTQGEYSLRVSDDGDFRLVLPNATGDDGRLHRDRFAVITDGRYRTGDEWIEIWRENEPDPEFVGSPVKATLTPTTITIDGT